jgi:hypothetical protein
MRGTKGECDKKVNMTHIRQFASEYIDLVEN